RFGNAGPRIDRFCVIAAEIARRGGADLKRHPDALAPVVVPTLANWTQVPRPWPDIPSLHLRVTLEAAARQHDLAHKTKSFALMPRVQRDDSSIAVPFEAVCRVLVEELNSQTLSLRSQRLHQRKPSTDWQQARLGRR